MKVSVQLSHISERFWYRYGIELSFVWHKWQHASIWRMEQRILTSDARFGPFSVYRIKIGRRETVETAPKIFPISAPRPLP